MCRKCLEEPAPLTAEFFCSSCRTPFQNGFPLDSEGRCALCRSGLRGFDAAYSYGSYEGTLRELIHLYKYGRIRTLAGPLGGFLRSALPTEERWDLIAAVPLHWRRRWERGFNQAELLARGLSHFCGTPFAPLLRRVRATPAQAGLSSARRRRNVASAFAVRGRAARKGELDGKRILLIDDVLTTGSTLAACARVLKRAGAERVAVLTVARSDRRFDVTPVRAMDRAAGDDAVAMDSAMGTAVSAGAQHWGVRV